jgi:hypothetical protein
MLTILHHTILPHLPKHIEQLADDGVFYRSFLKIVRGWPRRLRELFCSLKVRYPLSLTLRLDGPDHYAFHWPEDDSNVLPAWEPLRLPRYYKHCQYPSWYEVFHVSCGLRTRIKTIMNRLSTLPLHSKLLWTSKRFRQHAMVLCAILRLLDYRAWVSPLQKTRGYGRLHETISQSRLLWLYMNYNQRRLWSILQLDLLLLFSSHSLVRLALLKTFNLRYMMRKQMLLWCPCQQVLDIRLWLSLKKWRQLWHISCFGHPLSALSSQQRSEFCMH